MKLVCDCGNSVELFNYNCFVQFNLNGFEVDKTDKEQRLIICQKCDKAVILDI